MFITKKMREERVQGIRVLGGFMCFAAASMIVFSVVTAFRSFWPKTMAVVTDANIEKRVSTRPRAANNSHDTMRHKHKKSRTETKYILKVGYKYSIKGEEYEGRGVGYSDDDEAEVKSKLEDKYPVGRKIQIAYNPGDPTDTDLRPATLSMSFMLLVTALVVGFFGFRLTKTKMPSEKPSENY